MKIVEVHLYSQSNPVRIGRVANTYQKGDLYCVLDWDGGVQKFPLQHIFRIKEFG